MAVTWKDKGPNQFIAELPALVSVFRNPRWRKTPEKSAPWRVSIFGVCQHDLGWFEEAEEAQEAALKELSKKVRSIAKRLGILE